jgi:hypothetical protein
MKRMLWVMGALLLAVGFASTAVGAQELPEETTSTSGPETHKVFVCKYVGTPGVDEVLQTGDNPISVDIHAVDFPGIGAFFADGQFRSFVLAFDVGQDEPSPDECPDVTPPTTEPPTTTTTEGTTTTTTSTTLPPGVPTLFSVGGAGSVCVEGVPFIEITFGNRPDLDGEVGSLSFTSADGQDIGAVDVEFQSGETVQIIYPGAEVDENGVPIDFPGWELNADGFWVIDESDAFLRDGLVLTYTLGEETATAEVTYPPETEACADPDGPFPPGVTAPPTVPSEAPVATPAASSGGSPPVTGFELVGLVGAAVVAILAGVAGMLARRRALNSA